MRRIGLTYVPVIGSWQVAARRAEVVVDSPRMGEGDPEEPTAAAPTELAGSVSDTQSVRAWGLDKEDDVETRRFATPSRITGAAVLASLVVAMVAGTIAWQHLHRSAPPAGPTVVVAQPPPVVVPTPVLPPPPQPSLDGLYRVFHDFEHTTFRNNDRDGGGVVRWESDGEDPNQWWRFSSSCTKTECIATGHPATRDGKPFETDTTAIFTFANGSWEDASNYRSQSACRYDDGTIEGEPWISQRVTYHPRPDGTLTGELTTTVETNECGDAGNTVIVPLVLTREGDQA